MNDKQCNGPSFDFFDTTEQGTINVWMLFRNGSMVNLPWALLVKGDVVLIKPGQISPARFSVHSSGGKTLAYNISLSHVGMFRGHFCPRGGQN